MGCEICGRSGCTRSFHSLAEQEEHDNPTDWESKFGELEYNLQQLMKMWPESIPTDELESLITGTEQEADEG